MPAKITTVQQPPCPGLVDTRWDVMRDGIKIGNLWKNKYGMWCGDLAIAPAPTTYEEHRAEKRDIELGVKASRRKRETLEAIATYKPGQWARELRAQIAAADAMRALVAA